MPKFFDTPDGYDSHGRLFESRDGKLIAYGKNFLDKDPFFDAGTSCETINVRIPDLRMVEYVLDVNLTWDSFDCGEKVSIYNKKITGNVVGMTLSGDEINGNTLTVDVVAVGPP